MPSDKKVLKAVVAKLTAAEKYEAVETYRGYSVRLHASDEYLCDSNGFVISFAKEDAEKIVRLYNEDTA